jgi:TolB protein
MFHRRSRRCAPPGAAIPVPLPIALLATGLALCAPALLHAAPGSPEPIPSIPFRLEIVDARTGVPLPARITVRDGAGRSHWPIPRRSHHYHEAYFGHRYFYADGATELLVPPGPIVVEVSRGFEYGPARDTVVVDAGAPPVHRVLLDRLVDMPGEGWRSGDTHVHMDHAGGAVYELGADDLFRMQRAEDLHVVNVLENGVGFIGDVDPMSTADHKIHFGIEYRSAFWGHLGVLGARELTPFGCCSRNQPAWPMNDVYTESARAKGATVVFAHPITVPREAMNVTDQGWPSVGHGRELPIDVALGSVDAIDVWSYSNRDRIELSTWYDLLNHGFRIPATAGTDAAMNRFIDPPLGGYRVYAKVGAEWDYDEWLLGIRRGESFVTNGPLLRRFLVEGTPSGGVAVRDPGTTDRLFVLWDAVSVWPIQRLEIVVNGEVREVVPAGAASRFRMTGGRWIYWPGESSWVALRVIAASDGSTTIGKNLMAHANPVYIDAPGRPLRFGGPDPLSYVRWIDEVGEMAFRRGFPSEAEREAFRVRLERARRIVYSRTTVYPRETGEEPDVPLVPAAQGTAPGPPRPSASPNPSSGAITFTFADEAPLPESFELFDVAGRPRAARRLDQGELVGGRWTWHPGAEAPRLEGGVYFARFRGPGGSATIRLLRP